MTESFRICDIVYFVIDEINEPFMITGIVNRGDTKTYLVANKYDEKEVSAFTITKEKIIR
jgi:hypothetical protein